MIWKLFKNHSGKAQGQFEGRSVAVYMSSSNWPPQRSQNGFFNMIFFKAHTPILKLFKKHSGKAQADFGKRSVAAYMSFSKSGPQRSQNGFFNSF